MSEKRSSSGMTRRQALKMGAGAVAGVAAFGNIGSLVAQQSDLPSLPGLNINPDPGDIIVLEAGERTTVDFSYAFSTPHRITVARPDASDKTLLDLQPGSLKLSWTYDNLAMSNYYPLSFRTPPTLWNINITPRIDSVPISKSRWSRLDDVLPGLDNFYEDERGSVRLKVLGGITAALVRISIINRDTAPHQYSITCDSGNWGENPAWVDAKWNAGDNLVAGWNERADRVLVLGLGADSYSLKKDGIPPGPRNMILVWNMKAGEEREGWIVRPYNSYDTDLTSLRKTDWLQEMDRCKAEWQTLLGKASVVNIPDKGVSNAYMACLSDLFIMREPLADGRLVGIPGTEGYRAGNSGEPLIVAVAMDQNGLFSESVASSSTTVDTQEPDGCWSDKRGWGHTFWACAGFKSWAIMEHYHLTGDKNYLSGVYPKMIASSRWQEKQRARMRIHDDDHTLTYGLMPRGFGDCGLMNGDDMYGVFFPHNIWSVYADRCSLEAAEILGLTNDVPELKKIYETAYNDLLTALDRGTIREKDYRWIPGLPDKTTGSCWGALNILTPCRLLPPEHELVTGTLRKIEMNISKGGQPVHTGWMVDGAWVAITLDNVAEANLVRGNGDAAIRYLYSTLNHGTPLYTWCEERGLEPGTTKCSGDRQHLWTPVAVVRIIRDILVMEDGEGLNLALGTSRDWLGSGEPVGITGAYTHFGKVSYQMKYDSAASKVTGEISFPEQSAAAWVVLHIRLPEGMKIKSVNRQSKATLLPGGAGLKWKQQRGTIMFSATCSKG